MNKRNKRLTLHRETVRNLDDSRLRAAVGGTGGYTYNPGDCRTTCLCLDESGTFSATCTTECPATSHP